MSNGWNIFQEKNIELQNTCLKIPQTGDTDTLGVCHTDSSTDTMKSRLFDTFLHFLALFVTFLALIGTFCKNKKKSFIMCQESHFTCDISHVTCDMSHVTFHLSHVTFHLSVMHTATDLPLLTPPLATVDWFQIQKTLLNHGQKTL